MARLGSWLDEIKVFNVAPERAITFMPKGTSVEDCLRILNEKKILSAPVIDFSCNKFSGFIDMLDIMIGLLAAFPAVQEDEDIDYKYLQLTEQAGRDFLATKVEDVVALSRKYRQDESTFVTVELTAPVKVLARHFNEGLHRVAITDSKFNVVNTVSQSDLVAFLAKNTHVLANKLNKTITQLRLGTEGVVSVRPDKKTVAVLQSLVLNRISAVPVVDNDGKLVANFSVSDLRGLKKDDFPDMLLPVLEFLRKKVAREKPYISAIDSGHQCLIPLTCKASDTLEFVLLKLVATRTHRLWCVDDRGHPTRAVSLTDVMGALLAP
jgi:5'-AMP-activated protein kinase regulatory gamma subunit